jgi:hypothetical protein
VCAAFDGPVGLPYLLLCPICLHSLLYLRLVCLTSLICFVYFYLSIHPSDPSNLSMYPIYSSIYPSNLSNLSSLSSLCSLSNVSNLSNSSINPSMHLICPLCPMCPIHSSIYLLIHRMALQHMKQ